MDSQPEGSRPAHGRTAKIAALALGVAAIASLAVATAVSRLGSAGESAPAAAQAAQQRCETEVTQRLAAPASAEIADIHTEASSLDVDGRDLFSLTASEPLKGVDIGRITVFNVSGVVNAQNAYSAVIEDHFDCRAYFVDGALAHTLVVFDHAH